MENKFDVKKKVTSFYLSTVGIENMVKSMDNSIIDKSWSLGLSELSKSIEWVEKEIYRNNYSWDYSQAKTFGAYLRVVKNLVNEIKDNLTPSEEGLPKVKVLLEMFKWSYEPFASFICKRLKEVDAVADIPENIKGLYYKHENNNFEYADFIMAEEILNMCMQEDELDANNIEYIEERLDELGLKFKVHEILFLREIIIDSYDKTTIENSIELDF